MLDLPMVGQVEVLYRVVLGRAYWTGDVLLGDAADIPDDFRGATWITTGLWPDRTIKYRWDEGIRQDTRVALLAAMAQWSAVTPIRFVEDNLSGGGYVLLASDAPGCEAQLGYGGASYVTRLNLGEGCETTSVALHELGHVIGLWHEQSRSDREDHVDIDWDAIEDGQSAQFDMYSKAYDGADYGPYDFESIMHYGSFTYAKDAAHPVMTKKNGDLIPRPSTLSAGDVLTVAEMYASIPEPEPEPEPEPGPEPEPEPEPPGLSCEGRCGSSQPQLAPDGSTCYCDEICVEQGDCCDDHTTVCS